MEVNTTRFPSGMKGLADWLHSKGVLAEHVLLGPDHHIQECWSSLLNLVAQCRIEVGGVQRRRQHDMRALCCESGT